LFPSQDEKKLGDSTKKGKISWKKKRFGKPDAEGEGKATSRERGRGKKGFFPPG